MKKRTNPKALALDHVQAHATRALVAFKRGDREVQLIEEALAARWEERADRMQRAGY